MTDTEMENVFRENEYEVRGYMTRFIGDGRTADDLTEGVFLLALTGPDRLSLPSLITIGQRLYVRYRKQLPFDPGAFAIAVAKIGNPYLRARLSGAVDRLQRLFNREKTS